MAEITKNGITFDKDGGSGDATITVTADVNQGLDYTETFRISADAEHYADITVNMEGRREIFISDFILSGGDTFNVIKEGYE